MSDRPKTMLERVRDATLPAPLRGQVSDEFRAILERIPRELEQLFDARSLAVGTEFVDNEGTTAYGSTFTSPGTRIPISATGAAAVLNAYLARDDPTSLTTVQLLEVRRAVGDVLRPHIDLLQRGDATDPQAFSTDAPGMQLLREGVAENAGGLVLDDVLTAVGLDRDPRLHEVGVDPRFGLATPVVKHLTAAIAAGTGDDPGELIRAMAAAGPPEAALDVLNARAAAAHFFDTASPKGRVIVVPAMRAALLAGLVAADELGDDVGADPAEAEEVAKAIAERTRERVDRTADALRSLRRPTPGLDLWAGAKLPPRHTAPSPPRTRGAIEVGNTPGLYRAVPQLVAARLGAHCHVMFPVLHDGAMEQRYPNCRGNFNPQTGLLRLNQSTVHAVLASFFNGEYTSGDPRREVGERLALTRTLSALRTLIHESIHGAGQADRSAFLDDALTVLPGMRVLGEGFTEAAARSMVRDIAAAVGMTRRDPRLATISISGAYHTETAAAERLAAVVARRVGIPLHEELRRMAGAGAARLPLAVMVDQLLESAGVDPDSATARLVAAPAIERAILAPMAELEQRLPGLGSLDAQQLAGRQAADTAIRGADRVIAMVRRTAQVNTPTTRSGAPVRGQRERPLPGAA